MLSSRFCDTLGSSIAAQLFRIRELFCECSKYLRVEGKLFRRVLQGGTRQEAGVTPNVVWFAVKRCASQAGIANLAPHDLRRYAEFRIMPSSTAVRAWSKEKLVNGSA